MFCLLSYPKNTCLQSSSLLVHRTQWVGQLAPVSFNQIRVGWYCLDTRHIRSLTFGGAFILQIKFHEPFPKVRRINKFLKRKAESSFYSIIPMCLSTPNSSIFNGMLRILAAVFWLKIELMRGTFHTFASWTIRSETFKSWTNRLPSSNGVKRRHYNPKFGLQILLHIKLGLWPIAASRNSHWEKYLALNSLEMRIFGFHIIRHPCFPSIAKLNVEILLKIYPTKLIDTYQSFFDRKYSQVAN